MKHNKRTCFLIFVVSDELLFLLLYGLHLLLVVVAKGDYQRLSLVGFARNECLVVVL